MRIGPGVKARVYVMEGGKWKLSEGKVKIPEGWYLVSPRFVEESDK